jgi:hypothetical protein
VKTSEPADGGGKTAAKKNVVYMFILITFKKHSAI